MKQEFPQRLQKLRERRRMSRKARGEKEPTLASIVALADYFEVPADYLIGRQNYL